MMKVFFDDNGDLSNLKMMMMMMKTFLHLFEKLFNS